MFLRRIGTVDRDGEVGLGVLLSGDHARIRAWRECEARERGRARETD